MRGLFHCCLFIKCLVLNPSSKILPWSNELVILLFALIMSIKCDYINTSENLCKSNIGRQIFVKCNYLDFRVNFLETGAVCVRNPDGRLRMAKRTYQDKSTIQWNESWLQEIDIQGNRIGDWAVRESENTGKCKWCKVTFRFDNTGKNGFKNHAKNSTAHMINSAGRKGQLPNQRSLKVASTINIGEGEGEVLGEEGEVLGEEGEVLREEDVDDPAATEDEGVGKSSERCGAKSVSQAECGAGGEQHEGGGEAHRVANRGWQRGGGVVRRRVDRPPQQTASSKMTVNDRVHYAEARLALLFVEHDYSYKSSENWQQVLSSCDPSSEVFRKVTMNRKKASELVRFGLYPSMRDLLVKRIKQGFFVLGLDASVIHHLGIKKHMDIHVRYWSEFGGRVEDAFLDLHTVGHEPADLQVKELLKTLMEAGLPLAMMVGLSRDNPTVMKAVARILKQELEDRGTPGLIDLICYLHGTHTAFEKCEESLGEDEELLDEEEPSISISSLLSNLYSFMNSTARREDMTAVGQEFAGDEDFHEKLDQFYKRHISTRWLEMEPCLKRLLARWKTTVQYFTVFLPSSSSPSDKKALKTERYMMIYNAFKPDQEQKTKGKVKFLQYVCKQALPFLTTFQSTKPMVHLLHSSSAEMFESLARLILKPEVYREMVARAQYKEIDFFKKENLLPVSKMTSLSSLIQEEKSLMSLDDAYRLMYAMRNALQVMVTYLQSHLPLNDPFYKCLGFMDPRVRTAWTGEVQSLVRASNYIARELNRFDDDELMDLQRQGEMYQALQEVPPYNPNTDRVDEWWVKVWKMMEVQKGEQPKALMKLVKMCCILAHSQAWVERGFNISKMFVSDRESLNVHSMKALKTVHGEIKRQGGAEKVTITPTILNQVKMAGRDARAAWEKDRKKKEEENATEAVEKEMARKRKAEEDSKKEWGDKKKELETELRGIQTYIDSRSKFIKDKMSKQAKCIDPYKMRDLATSIRLATEDKETQAVKERQVQEMLRIHMGKRHKEVVRD